MLEPDEVLEFVVKPRTSGRYSFQFLYHTYEVAYILCSLNETHLYIEDIVSYNDNFKYLYTSWPVHYCGRKIFNHSLLDLCFRQNKNITSISGTLSSADRNRRWARSIPFYIGFPKHLNECLPYDLALCLYDSDHNVIQIPIEEKISEFVSDLIKNYSEINFTYSCIPKK